MTAGERNIYIALDNGIESYGFHAAFVAFKHKIADWQTENAHFDKPAVTMEIDLVIDALNEAQQHMEAALEAAL